MCFKGFILSLLAVSLDIFYLSSLLSRNHGISVMSISRLCRLINNKSLGSKVVLNSVIVISMRHSFVYSLLDVGSYCVLENREVKYPTEH